MSKDEIELMIDERIVNTLKILSSHTLGEVTEEDVDSTIDTIELSLKKKKEKYNEQTSKGTLTNAEAVQIIENEGIGYAVQSYISGSEFKDVETVRLWFQAEQALDELKEHLGME